MENLFLIIGAENIRAWDNEVDEIDLNKVFKKTFDSQKEKDVFVSALYLLDYNMGGNRGENYIIIDEDEYNFLIN